MILAGQIVIAFLAALAVFNLGAHGASVVLEKDLPKSEASREVNFGAAIVMLPIRLGLLYFAWKGLGA